MTYLYPKTKIIIFTKPPIAGKCKSRLIPHLGAIGAAKLQEKLIFKIIDQLKDYKLCPFEVCLSEANQDFIEILNEYSVDVSFQKGKDLGARMSHAILSNIEDNNSVIIIGSDCAEFSKDYFIDAITELESNKVVLGPAFDGGYVLIGMSEFVGSVFKNVNWGTNEVLQSSCQILESEDQSFALLSKRHDIDTPDDLKYL